MGKIMQKAKLQNIVDLSNLKKGYIDSSQIHEIEVDFLVDTGAAMVCLPPDLIEKLDLYVIDERNAVTANGKVKRRVYSEVRINVMGREAGMNVMEVSANVPPLMGYLLLERLDLYPNPTKQCLEGNPKHDGEFVLYQL